MPLLSQPARTLVIVCAGVVMASLDMFIVNVALPQISVDWSPGKTYGGFYAKPSGVRRAFGLVDAAAESEEQRNWRETRGEHAFDVIHHHHSPLDDCLL